MSRICNVSKKTLRYYDEIGLIPCQRKEDNNYRYYTNASVLAVPVIKYYKQMGFTLEEMRRFIEGDVGNVYSALRRSFKAKLEELEQEQEDIRRKCISVKDWHALITEAEMVIDNTINDVSVKYVPASTYLYQDQVFDDDLEASIINIAFTNYAESLRTEVTGPIILRFPCLEDRIEGRGQPIRIMQKTLTACDADRQTHFGGRMMAACYHIGPHAGLGETYRKIRRWARNHGYVLAAESFERYVADYWTTRNSAQFVTEILLGVSRQAGG